MTSPDTTDPVLLTEVENRIATITLNRPARRNALNGELIVALDEAVQEMADRSDVKVVILTGAPAEGATGGFCSGGDTRDGGAPPPHLADRVDPLPPLEGDLARHQRQAAMLLHTMPKPSIAMIGGPAVGAGFSLAGACDLRYASPEAVFASNFSANGLSGDYGGTFFWTRIIGTARTRQLYLLNDRIGADQALEWGMVHDVVPAEKLKERTWAIAERLLRVPASLLGLVKDNLNQAEDDADRRNFLFANEAANQRQAVADITERMKAKSRPDPA